jgi:hypothetical protein
VRCPGLGAGGGGMKEGGWLVGRGCKGGDAMAVPALVCVLGETGMGGRGLDWMLQEGGARRVGGRCGAACLACLPAHTCGVPHLPVAPTHPPTPPPTHPPLPPPPPTPLSHRVLIFLEALALGRPTPAFGLHLCSALLAAAQHLGLRPLEVRPSPHGWHWVLYRWCRVPYRWRRVPHRPCALWHALRTAAETGCAAGVLPGCALSEQGTACQTRHTSAAECCSFY